MDESQKAGDACEVDGATGMLQENKSGELVCVKNAEPSADASTPTGEGE